MKRTGRRVDERGGLAGEGLARAQPVERVFQRAREPLGVFRGGDDERIARIDERAKRLDRLRPRLFLTFVCGGEAATASGDRGRKDLCPPRARAAPTLPKPPY